MYTSKRSRNSGDVSRDTNMHASKGTAKVSSVSDFVSSYPHELEYTASIA